MSKADEQTQEPVEKGAVTSQPNETREEDTKTKEKDWLLRHTAEIPPSVHPPFDEGVLFVSFSVPIASSAYGLVKVNRLKEDQLLDSVITNLYEDGFRHLQPDLNMYWATILPPLFPKKELIVAGAIAFSSYREADRARECLRLYLGGVVTEDKFSFSMYHHQKQDSHHQQQPSRRNQSTRSVKPFQHERETAQRRKIPPLLEFLRCYAHLFHIPSTSVLAVNTEGAAVDRHWISPHHPNYRIPQETENLSSRTPTPTTVPPPRRSSPLPDYDLPVVSKGDFMDEKGEAQQQRRYHSTGTETSAALDEGGTSTTSSTSLSERVAAFAELNRKNYRPSDLLLGTFEEPPRRTPEGRDELQHGDEAEVLRQRFRYESTVATKGNTGAGGGAPIGGDPFEAAGRAQPRARGEQQQQQRRRWEQPGHRRDHADVDIAPNTPPEVYRHHAARSADPNRTTGAHRTCSPPSHEHHQLVSRYRDELVFERHPQAHPQQLVGSSSDRPVLVHSYREPVGRFNPASGETERGETLYYRHQHHQSNRGPTSGLHSRHSRHRAW